MTRITPRAIEALELAARGMSNREIADALGVTEQNVKNRLSEAFAALGVQSRTAACIAAEMLVPRQECGVVMRCTRPAAHTGQHGGFRKHGPGA